MSEIIRAYVEVYDSGAHTADVAPITGPASRLSLVPVLESCPTDLIEVGDVVALVIWPDGLALVLGPFGGVP